VAFGRAVRSLRIRAGHNQEAFAHKCDMDRAYYGNIERGEHGPTIATVWRLAEALDKRPRDIIAAVELEIRIAESRVQSKIAPKAQQARQKGGGSVGDRSKQ